MSFTQDELEINGHAIEVRINAEKIPGFSPQPRRVRMFHAPGGLACGWIRRFIPAIRSRPITTA
jgi:acetyl/propionyl-CoA carboxylase alpha subunit